MAIENSRVASPQVARGLKVAAAVLVLAGVLVAARARPPDQTTSANGGVAPQGTGRGSAAINSALTPEPSGPTGGNGASTTMPLTAEPSTGGTRGPGGSGPASGATPARSIIPTGAGVHGVTDSTIQVGLRTLDSRAFNATFGAVSGNPDAGNPDGWDPDAVNSALIDYVNKTGGIAGRKVEPVYYFTNIQNAANASGRQQEAQAACAHWTEDNHVFAMMMMQDELMFECAARTHTPVLSGWLATPYISERRVAAMANYWYAPSTFTADRQDWNLATFLQRHGFFSPGAKVGVLVYDVPMQREGYERGLKPALASIGVKPALEIFYPDAIESTWSNYVLQLRSAGVTHVLFAAGMGGFFPGLFMLRSAEDQQYRPKWGMSSNDSPDGLITTGGVSPNQMKNVTAMGWLPVADVGDATPQGAHGAECARVLRDAGQPENTGQETCEFLLFLRDGFALAPEVSPAGLAAGVAKLAGGYTSPNTTGGVTFFDARHHDGAASVRIVVYDAKKNRMVYGGPAEPLPRE